MGADVWKGSDMLEKFVSKYLVRGRERSGYIARRQDMVSDIVSELMTAMDVDKDGVVSLDDFLAWSNMHNLEGFVEDYYAHRVMLMEQELDELRAARDEAAIRRIRSSADAP